MSNVIPSFTLASCLIIFVYSLRWHASGLHVKYQSELVNKLLTRKEKVFLLVMDNLAESFCSLKIRSTSDNRNQLQRSTFFDAILYNHFFPYGCSLKLVSPFIRSNLEKLCHHNEWNLGRSYRNCPFTHEAKISLTKFHGSFLRFQMGNL